MAMSLHRIKGAAIVALAAVIAEYGAGSFVRAATGTARDAVSSPRRDDPRQTTAEPPSKLLAGVVRDDEGRPVAGATVVAGQFGGGEPNLRIGTTGSDGRFELTPGGKSARLEYVVVHKEGLAPASSLRLRGNDRANEGEVQVEGKVVDARNGNPVANVGIGLYGPMRPRSGAAIVSAKTDFDGRYRFRLPPGQTHFYICGPVPAEYGRRVDGGHTVEIPADEREFAVPDIQIRPESLKP